MRIKYIYPAAKAGRDMKTVRNILIAFILNLCFAIAEFIGGIFTGSIAILSDSIHDLGDATTIGVSYFLEKKSKKQPDLKYTYGYARYSVIGSIITTMVLIVGSALVIYGAIDRIINPKSINIDGMIIFASCGVVINFIAAWFTKEGDSVNQKAVNLHMLEDVLGWIVVLIGAVVMKFTSITIIDPIMSICVALFILFFAVKNLIESFNLVLEKLPKGMDVEEIKHHLLEIDGVIDIHHIHIWTLDGNTNYATLHVVSDVSSKEIKKLIKDEFAEHGIKHVTIEIETSEEKCEEHDCHVDTSVNISHHHHHH